MIEKLNLTGKTIVITGGGTGLGKEMSLSMADAGADIIIAARRIEPIEEVAKQIRAIGSKSIAISTDATNTDEV